MDKLFRTSAGLQCSIENVVEETIRFMQDQPNYSYTVTIGTDSALLESKNADFVSAIVVHRVGNGGRYFWRRFNLGKFFTLRDRIIREVLISLELAQELLAKLKEASDTIPGFPHWDFEVHADVGEGGPTRTMMQEVVGMIRAHNFEPRTKPESYAATSVADKHV